MAQPSTVCRVVGVHASCHELASVEWVVVGVGGWLGAGGAVSMLCCALAHRVLGQYRALEPGVVLVVVATLPCCAAVLLRYLSVLGAAS